MRVISLIGSEKSRKGDAMNKVVSNIDGVHGAVVAHADFSCAQAQMRLAQHKHDGDAKVTVTEGDVDAFVNLDDTAGQQAALSIEFGHKGRNGKPVPGLYIITKSTGMVR